MSCQTQAQVFFLVWSGVSFSFNTSSGFAKGLTPDKLTGGWRGDLAKLSRTWEVMLIYCVILQSLLRVNSNFPPASVFTVCFKWNFKVFVLDTNVLMHHLEVAEVILHIINSLKFSKWINPFQQCFQDLLSCDGPMIYIAAIVRTEHDGLKKSSNQEVPNLIMCSLSSVDCQNIFRQLFTPILL